MQRQIKDAATGRLRQLRGPVLFCSSTACIRGDGNGSSDEFTSDRSDHPAFSGGASTAELAALTAFAADPSLRVIWTTSVKQFGEHRKSPPGTAVYFRGNDSDDGPLLRCTVITWALRHTKADSSHFEA
jgi:hypothetical protein